MNEHVYNRNDLVFWSDVQYQLINAAHFNGSNLRALISTGITVPGNITYTNSIIIVILMSSLLSFLYRWTCLGLDQPKALLDRRWRQRY